MKEYKTLKTEFDALYSKLNNLIFYWFLQSIDNGESVFVTADVKKLCNRTPHLYNSVFDAVSVDHILQINPYVIVDTHEEAIKIDEGAKRRKKRKI